MLLRKLLFLLTAALLLQIPAASYASIMETFDSSGTNISNSMFPKVIVSGNGTFERRALTVSDGAPNVSPPLPVNIGGDKELIYFEESFAPYAGYAVTEQQSGSLFTDTIFDAYTGFGTATYGSHTAGLLSRFSETATSAVNAYMVYMGITEAFTEGYLNIARIRNGVVTASDVLSESINFSIDPDNENYHITFSTIGDDLRASLWSVKSQGGLVVETPIDLLGASGIQNTLVASDSELLTGDMGFRVFARNGNTVFFDDVSITAVPEPSTIVLLGSGLIGLIGLRRKLT